MEILQKIYSILYKYKGLIFSWIVVLLLGAFYGKGCSDNRYLQQMNSEYEQTIKELNNENGILFEMRKYEKTYREAVQDSLVNLSQKNIALEQAWAELNKNYVEYKIIIVDIDTDHKRDSLWTAWYPAPGQRRIPAELEK